METQDDSLKLQYVDMGKYPVVGPVPIRIAAQAVPSPSHVGGVRGHRYGGLGGPSVGCPSAGILGESTSEKGGESSGARGPAWIGGSRPGR